MADIIDVPVNEIDPIVENPVIEPIIEPTPQPTVMPAPQMAMPNDIPRKAWQNVEDLLGTLNDYVKTSLSRFESQMNEIAEKADRNQLSATQAIKQLRDLMEQATNEPTPNAPAPADPAPNPLPEPKKYKGYAGRKRG